MADKSHNLLVSQQIQSCETITQWIECYINNCYSFLVLAIYILKDIVKKKSLFNIVPQTLLCAASDPFHAGPRGKNETQMITYDYLLCT